MKQIIIILLCIVSIQLKAKKVTYTVVALCDNVYQGIVPVPVSIGNGDSPRTNLYWGCGYGVRTYFKKSSDWVLLKKTKVDSVILERCIFFNKKNNTYHIADAYRGKHIQKCTEDFFLASAGKLSRIITVNDSLKINMINAQLINYVGHDGLMDFNINSYPKGDPYNDRKVTILACYSKSYFKKGIQLTHATPYIWTTHLMAPEAYTLHDIIGCWMTGKSGKEADEAAAQAYNKYQKCGIRGARNLFTTGF
jgi:hypothetical protein